MSGKRVKGRCPWPGTDPLYVAYHDEEWGVPERDDRALYEKLVLDGFQAGLSWITILRKREAFRRAFDGFAPEKIARYSNKKVEALMQDAGHRAQSHEDRGRGRLGARLARDHGEGRGLRALLWDFVGRQADRQPLQDDEPRSPPRRSCRATSQRTSRRAASNFAARRSSMPSCRRPAWSTTT